MKTNAGGRPVLCLAICEIVLKKLFENLTEMLMFPCRSDVAE